MKKMYKYFIFIVVLVSCKSTSNIHLNGVYKTEYIPMFGVSSFEFQDSTFKYFERDGLLFSCGKYRIDRNKVTFFSNISDLQSIIADRNKVFFKNGQIPDSVDLELILFRDISRYYGIIKRDKLIFDNTKFRKFDSDDGDPSNKPTEKE